jgi:ATP-dependent DNA helicase RecQ
VTYDHDRALALLRLGSGMADATFRDGQEAAIRHVAERRGRLLVVQRTGWGKSFVYFIATKLSRDAGAGPTLLVSPLISLMRNQLTAAGRMGVRAATIHSENATDWSDIEARLGRDELDVLLISPERLVNERFIAMVLERTRIGMLVIDEAHCISDWGHDFRPHYRLLERFARTLPPNLPLLATTATANRRVMADLQAVLGAGLAVSTGELDRPSLTLQTIRLPDQAQRLAWLAGEVPALAGSGIIYTLTVRDARQVTEWLSSRGIPVAAYTGQSQDREALEQALLDNRLKALVATTALGMGFDKPDLAFVIHFQTPGSAVAYYQQVGRAGRACPAYGVLLSGAEETAINDFFVESAFPSREEVALVLEALEAEPEGLSVPELMSRVNLSKGRIEKTIALLSLESPAPIAKQDSRWNLTAAQLGESFWERAERLTALRREEQREMQEYVALASGHMEFLVRALDGDPSGVAPVRLPPLPTEPDPILVRDAIDFLKRSSLPIEERKQWPPGGLPLYEVSGKIRVEHRARAGKALCVWGDAGWGALVREGKHTTGRFDDALVGACVELIRAWNPQPAPTWVTCVPSLRRPTLVSDFAQRLAAALALPFDPVLIKTEPRPEQRDLANSTQQARNVDGSLALARARPSAGPVLLVDDVIDSGWTITVAAWLLRRAGSGDVWPLALVKTGGGE